jgi:hypothetical protein
VETALYIILMLRISHFFKDPSIEIESTGPGPGRGCVGPTVGGVSGPAPKSMDLHTKGPRECSYLNNGTLIFGLFFPNLMKDLLTN